MAPSPTRQPAPGIAGASRSCEGISPYIVVIAAGCVALVVSLLLGHRIPAAVMKIVASTAFVALAFRVGAWRSTFGRLLLLGLVLSWFGDVFLIGESRRAFLAGLAAFLLAHLAYVSAFIVRGIDIRWASLAAIPVIAAGLAVSMWLTPHLPAGLVVPVRVYTAVISLMVIAAIGTRGRGASNLLLAGAVLFFLSDLSVAALRLVQTDFPTFVWGLPFYYAGQACLALGSSSSQS